MKKFIPAFLYIVVLGLMLPGNALCEGMSNQEIVDELKNLKARILQLEEQLKEKDQEIQEMKSENYLM